MTGRKRVLWMVTLATATAVDILPVVAPEPQAGGKPNGKGPRKPQTPKELREARGFADQNGDTRLAAQQYPKSPRTMQHAGQHKNTGTKKGHPLKR